MSGYIIALIIFLAWMFFALFMHRFKSEYLKKKGMSFWGPILMVRTERGRKFIKWLSTKERFWRFFGDASVVIVVVFMASMFLLLIWTATIVPTIPREQAPTPQMLIGIPGVNPLIPVWYGIWGIAVAILIHEFTHGILAFNGGMRLKSLGLVFMAIPIGAFVEPEEEDLKGAQRRKRMRVYASGPSSNILFSLACVAVFSLLFMGSITPASQGAPITYILEGTPAWEAGMEKGDFITSLDGLEIASISDFRRSMNNTRAGDNIDVGLYHKSSGNRNTTLTLGYWKSYDDVHRDSSWYRYENSSIGIIVEELGDSLYVSRVLNDSPASISGMREGDTLSRVNGTVVTTMDEYNTTLILLVPGQETTVEVLRSGLLIELDIISGAGKGYMGLLISPYNLEGLAAYLHRPTKGFDGPGDLFSRIMGFVSMPFQTFGPEDKLTPMRGLITDLYVVEGPMSFLPESIFWISANLLFWAFWISLMVGLTNSLPAVPMDGGYVFHDLLTGMFSKKEKNSERVEKAVDRLAITLAMLVLMLVLWQIVGPRLSFI